MMWQPIETAPNETDVLCCVDGLGSRRIVVAGRFQGWRDGPWGWYTYEAPEVEVKGITHWMPLPEAPE